MKNFVSWDWIKDPIWLFSLVGFILLIGAVLGQSLRIPFSHDEHQFIASGALIADGYLPYRDFPLHHLPYLSFLLAIPPLFMDKLLLAGRLSSVVFSVGTLVLVYWQIWKAFAVKDVHWAPLAAFGGCLAIASSNLFAYTSGRAWNHDLSVFLIMASMTLTLANEQGRDRIFLSGLFIGLAVGVRLTAVLVFLPVVAYLVWPNRSNLPGSFSPLRKLLVGGSVALVPSIVLFLLAPNGFLYGNWVYHRLNTRYRAVLAHGDAMGLVSKIEYFIQEIALDGPNLILGAVFLLALFALLFRKRKDPILFRQTTFAIMISISLVIGALLPTPSWQQYYYAPMPFLVLATSFGLANLAGTRFPTRIMAGGLLVLACVMAILRGGFIQDWSALLNPERSTVSQAHQISKWVAEHVDHGEVVTLGPIYALEAGASIEPALATGPFTWRVAPLLDEADRDRFGIKGSEELLASMASDSPVGIMTGFEAGNIGFASSPEGSVETPLVDFASANHYRPYRLTTPVFDQPLTLWVSPR